MVEYWMNGKIRLDLKVGIDKIRLKPTIPSFHYSRIDANAHASKNILFIQPVVEIPRR